MFEMDCPLCSAFDASLFYQGRRREYLRCARCRLVFVAKRYWPTAEQEKSRYDQHNNTPGDPGYRRFLERLFRPMQQRLPANSKGLDYGCGPGPTLSILFEEAGHHMSLYDPFYARQPEVLQRNYTFITSTEVVEHMFAPGEELQKLWDMLIPGGLLGLMTKMVLDREAFSRWHYKNDNTHVCFFSRETFLWWSCLHAAQLEFVEDDVVLLRKTEADGIRECGD